MPASGNPPSWSGWILAVAIGSSSCAERPHEGSDLGREFASRLCPIQADCDCDEELLIPQCERRVEQEFLETERAALERGFVLDSACMERFLDDVEARGACERVGPGTSPICPVYTGNAEAGEPCEYVGYLPLMMECRAGLSCIEGVCRDLQNPEILEEGEICSETQGYTPTGWLGYCAEGLTCDSQNTRTCIPSPHWPEVPLGEECVDLGLCETGSYCRPQGTIPEEISEDTPGICTLPSQPGEPCTYVHECTTYCVQEQGRCRERPIGMCDLLEAWWDVLDLRG